MNYIIDGYNLGFAIPAIAEQISRDDTDQAIRSLIRYIQGFFPGRSGRVILVFDGVAESRGNNYNSGPIEVRFSKKPQTADDIIRGFVRKIKNARHWTVVSSDHEIRNTARDMGAAVQSSAEFLNRQGSAKKQRMSREISQKYNPGTVDMEYWLKVFGESGSKE